MATKIGINQTSLHFIDCVKNADYVLDQLESLCSRFTDLPERGHIPPELDRIGVTNYREVNFKPYRVIYEVIRQDVFVHCILGGRRDIASLLERRLIR
ncbi:MAG: type II toxin-antitoxin system RelE/ParE family toxin [Gammaproteobacteria bacterium]|nr:MAG: type II toxin-antitoxin system RelE/ParE family toxin [Gammaproteobacteria bacterium]